MTLEDVWRIREEEVYPQLFGPVSRGIFVLSHELFSEQMGQGDRVDPRWLHHGVIEYAPTPKRASWLYVTSGYSNPWDEPPQDYNPEGESGSGIEFTLHASEQGDWAIQALQTLLAFDIVLAAGRFSGREPMSIHDRVPLPGPINGDVLCQITNVILTQTFDGPNEFTLPSGRVELLNIVGFTDAELEFAQEHGSPEMLQKLNAAGFYQLTDPKRASVV
jgi:hypothetical protein